MRKSARSKAFRQTGAWLAACSVALLSGATAAHARDKDEALPPPPVFQAVIDCRAQVDPAVRLACYDRSVGAMADARSAKTLIVTDQAAVREAKRGLFGLSLPSLKLFGGSDGAEVNEIESTITAVRNAPDGFAIFTLEDGARWKQTDGGNTFAKAGKKIRIRRAALGSFIANIDNQVGVRVIRLPN